MTGGQAPPRVGETAPGFTLASTAGADVTLSAYRGRNNVLLAFFPLAFTRVCTAELRAFSEDFDRFAELRAVVLPISVDSVPTLKEFKAKHGMKVGHREGKLRWAHVEAELRDRREDAELLAQIQALS